MSTVSIVLEVTSERYCMRLVHYIHFNPQKHGFVADFREYPYSSYRAFFSDKPTKLEQSRVLAWFGGRCGVRCRPSDVER